MCGIFSFLRILHILRSPLDHLLGFWSCVSVSCTPLAGACTRWIPRSSGSELCSDGCCSQPVCNVSLGRSCKKSGGKSNSHMTLQINVGWAILQHLKPEKKRKETMSFQWLWSLGKSLYPISIKTKNQSHLHGMLERRIGHGYEVPRLDCTGEAIDGTFMCKLAQSPGLHSVRGWDFISCLFRSWDFIQITCLLPLSI